MFSKALVVTLVLGALIGKVGFAAEREEVSITEQRRAFETTRWLFSTWAKAPSKFLEVSELQGKPTSEYIRKFVSAEQFAALQKAYDKRRVRHQELRAIMDSWDVMEQRTALVKRGKSEQEAALVYPKPRGFTEPTREELQTALRTYVREQDEAEQEWVATLDEVLTPEQFEKLIPFFIGSGNSYLANPLFAAFLKYDKAQQLEIQKRVDLFNTTMTAAKRDPKFDPANDKQVKQVYLKTFTALTPTQFMKLAPYCGMKKEDESWKELRARMKGDFEKLIGPLVDGVIEHLDK